MKSKEEYLINYEDRLITKLESNYTELNRNILYCFSLIFIFILFEFKLLDDASIFGIQISLTNEQLLIIMPLAIIVPYFLVNNCVLTIARIVDRLLTNSEDLKKINENSRPFKPDDLEVLSHGIGGLQLQFSKWIVTKYLTDRKFLLTVDTPQKNTLKEKIWYTLLLPYKLFSEFTKLSNNIIRTGIWLLFLVLIYILPLVISIWIVYSEKLEVLFTEFHFLDIFNWYFLIGLFLVLMVIYTLMTNLLLYSLYFSEITDLKNNVKDNAFIRINYGFSRIINYYKRKKTDDSI